MILVCNLVGLESDVARFAIDMEERGNAVVCSEVGIVGVGGAMPEVSFDEDDFWGGYVAKFPDLETEF